MLTYKLNPPYTVTMIPPVVDISFGTQNALGAYNVGGLCLLIALEPIVTVTIR